MAATPKPAHIKYLRADPPGAGHYDVLYKDERIGRVGRFGLGAGQFGSRWVATTPRRKRSGQYTTRDAASSWLLAEARVSRRV